MTADLAARNLAVIGHAHFVGNVGLGELLLRFPDERNLRNGINAVGIAFGVAAYGKAERACAGDAALFHRHGGQTWKSDHIADGENVFLRGTEIRVYGDSSAVVSGNIRRLEI